MRIELFLFGTIAMAFAMVVAKRITALINGFRAQSFFLFMLTLILAVKEGSGELYTVAVLLCAIKVVAIPYFLRRTAKSIKVNENLGLFINPAVSTLIAILLTYAASLFAGGLLSGEEIIERGAFTVSLATMLIGMFIMVSRITALAQIIGLMAMENGVFLAAISMSDGMPFFVEIAIFFDLLLCVLILGVFVYRIRKLFTHIDIDKLTELKG